MICCRFRLLPSFEPCPQLFTTDQDFIHIAGHTSLELFRIDSCNSIDVL